MFAFVFFFLLALFALLMVTRAMKDYVSLTYESHNLMVVGFE